MRRRQIDRDIVVLLAFTLVTLASWVGFEVYRAYKQVRIPEVLQKHLQEVSPVLDTSVLDTLEKRSP